MIRGSDPSPEEGQETALAAARRRIAELELVIEARERASTLTRDPLEPDGHNRPSELRPPARRLPRLEDELGAAHALLDQREHWLEALDGALGDRSSPAHGSPLHPRWSPRNPIPVAIVVPVHNAPAELRECVESLAANTTYPARVLLIDDASTDPQISAVLAGAERLAGVEVLYNSVNHGFSATVNRGIRAAAGQDVVVLNSDTAVTPHWLERLLATAYSDPLIATVTPVSDNAGAFSVPEIGVPNPVPAFLDYDAAGRAIGQYTQRRRPRTPTGNGFCLYIKRAVVDELGYFDAEAFPRGYGEENDFCMRALGRGWHHVVDDGVFVHHVREASFGASKEQLVEQGRAVVDQRHPQYTGLVREFVRSSDMAAVRATVAHAYDEAERCYEQGGELRPRVLFVAHEGSGGTPATNLDLMAGLEHEYDPWLLSCTGRELWLDRMVDGDRVEVQRVKLERPISPLGFSRQDYRAAVTEILDRYAIELIHIRHLFKHTFDLPSVAASRGIPVVFSFHDFYFTCPTVHLLDDHLQYCGGICTPGLGNCRIPSAILEGLPPLKHRFVYEWREEVQRMLADVDTFVTTSPHARNVHLTALPALEDRPFEIIEHGRDLIGAAVAVAPVPGGPVRIAVPTTLDLHKGAELMRVILEHDGSDRIEFHLFGDVPAQYADLGQSHGRYRRDELTERLADVRPAFVGIFSIWPETYSHVLSEAWAAGVPVLATALGAPRERIERAGGGWLIDPYDPAAALRAILAVADDPAEYARGQASATVRNLRTVAQMAGDYSTLYRRVIDSRRALVPRGDVPGSRHLSHRVLRAELIAPGSGDEHPACTDPRPLGRYLHPSIRRKLHLTVQRGNELGEIPAERDLVIVQRDSLTPDQVEKLLAVLNERDLPLVLDLDDDPIAPELDRLLSAASLVTVPSRRLQQRLAQRGVRALLVRDMIDERLFFAGREQPSEPRPAGAPARMLFAGSPDDRCLTMLEPVLRRLRRRRVRIELAVVEPHGSYPEWIRFLRAHRHEWDFAIAPLDDIEPERSRSDRRYLEYAALGLPGAYSALEPYESVTDGVTGLLVPCDRDAWFQAIRRLAEDPALREAIAGAALRQVQDRMLIRHGSDRLLSALFDLAHAAPARSLAGRPGRERSPSPRRAS